MLLLNYLGLYEELREMAGQQAEKPRELVGIREEWPT